MRICAPLNLPKTTACHHSYSPHIIQPWFALAKSIYKLQTIQPQPRELAILAVTSVYHAPYVVYAHECLAAKVGISPEQVQMAVRGETPDGLNEVEAASYVLAKQLAHAQAPISDELWDAAYKVLGREGAVGVAHVVSGYLYVCTLEKIATPTVQSKDSAE